MEAGEGGRNTPERVLVLMFHFRIPCSGAGEVLYHRAKRF